MPCWEECHERLARELRAEWSPRECEEGDWLAPMAEEWDRRGFAFLVVTTANGGEIEGALTIHRSTWNVAVGPSATSGGEHAVLRRGERTVHEPGGVPLARVESAFCVFTRTRATG